MPAVPSTKLDNLVSFLAGVPDIPATVIGGITMLGIPILVVAGLTRRRGWRALITAVVVALVATIGWAFTPTNDVDPYGMALLLATFVVAAVAIRAWGARSAWSWFVAALFYVALQGLREAVYGPVWQARIAGGLTLLVATALIALITRRAVRPPGQDSSIPVIS
jgi:hypothetical protein